MYNMCTICSIRLYPSGTYLALWHRLEERNPELFGRMHHVYARYVPDG